ncbi:MAG: DUF3108 domain-containing protein, partial [Candidatus Berkiellales bacterium]
SLHRLHQRKDGHYHFETHTEPRIRMLPFHYVESSDFTWNNGKIQPLNYYYNVREGKRRKKGNVLFDWQHQKVANYELKEPWESVIPRDLQDKITQTLCLRQGLLLGQSNLNYTVAEEDKIKNYAFTILGKEHLKTKIGTLETIKVQHISRKGAQTTLWLAKKYEYLPVKITQTRHGKLAASGEILTFTPNPKNQH